MSGYVHKNLITVLFALLLSSCSTSRIDFSDRNDLAATRGEESIHGIKYMDYGVIKTVHTLGAITIARSDFNKIGEKADPMVFDLKRSKSRFYAETNFFESDNKERSFFDKGMVNFGVDKKAKGVGMELSLQF